MSEILEEEFSEEHYILAEEEIIGEGENAKKRICFKGIFSESNSLNGNKRMYPEPVLKEVYEQAMKEAKRTGTPVIGELEHAKDSHINLERIAVTFPELRWENGKIVGKAVPTLTEAGKVVEGLAKSGIPIKFSTRMSGRVKPMTEERKREFNITEDCVEVLPGARLISIDVVGTPSCQKAIATTVYEEKQETESKTNFKQVFDNMF